MINLLFLIFTNLHAAVTIEDVPQSYDELDSYALVEALIQDDQLSIAEQQLRDLSDSSQNLYYQAKIDFKKNDFSGAIEKWQGLLKTSKMQNQIHKDLAEAYANSNQFQLCVKSFKKAKDLNSIENRLYAVCAEKIKNYDLTFFLLNLFQDEKTILQKVLFLKKLELKEEARRTALNFILARPPLQQALNLQSHFAEDEVLLEALRVIYSKSFEVQTLWAHQQYKKGFILYAASGYENAAWLGHKDSFLAAAELWRSIGFYKKSQQLGSFISDTDQKLRLNLSLALDEENYAKLTGLSGLFSRSSVLSRDQDLLYAFYYSFYQLREVEKAQFYKSQMTRSDLIHKLNRIEK